MYQILFVEMYVCVAFQDPAAQVLVFIEGKVLPAINKFNVIHPVVLQVKENQDKINSG
jgi:hypothetical protein